MGAIDITDATPEEIAALLGGDTDPVEIIHGEIAAAVHELERDGLVIRTDDLFTFVQCDCEACTLPATQWSELNPKESICYICADIEADQL